HSKKAAGDGGDGLGAILAEIFAGFGNGLPAFADEERDEVAQSGEGTGSGTNPAAILVERNVANVVELVLDGPMCTIEFEQALGAGFFSRQTGDEIGDLDAIAPLDVAMALDAHRLRRAWPVKMGHHFRADGDFAELDPAVILVDGLSLTQIGRRAAGGKDRRRPR